MRKLTVFIVFFLLALTIAAQQNTYNKINYYFGDSLNSSAYVSSITKLDSFYVLAINGDSNNMWSGLHIVKVDKMGNRVKSQHWIYDTTTIPIYEGNSILIDNESNIVFAANKHHQTGTYEWDGFVGKLDSNMDTIWTRTYNLPDSLLGCSPRDNVFFAIKQCLDGNYIISARYYLNCNHIPDNQRTYLLKLDKQGIVLWRKMYSDVSHVYDILVSPDSGFVFTQFPAIGTSWTLNKTDNKGNIIWSKTPNNLSAWKAGALNLTTDNKIIALSSYVYSHPYPQTYLRGANVVKFDLAGNKIWDKTYKTHISLDCPTLHQNFEIEALPNGNILVVGTVNIQNPNHTNEYSYQGFTMMLNSNGDSLWSRYYGNRDFVDKCQFNDVVLTDDGGFLAVGYHKPNGNVYNYGAWLVKMDSMGMAPGAQTVGLSALLEHRLLEIDIYPNPAHEVVHFELAKPLTQDASVVVYNAMGQVVLEEVIMKNQQHLKLNVNDLEPGVYLYELKSTKAFLSSGKFIVK